MRIFWEVDVGPVSSSSTTQKRLTCESFFYLYSLIRCSRITSDEENVNKLLCDARLRDFCDGELNYTKTTHSVSRFSIYTALLDVIESRVMKRTSIRYCAVRSFEPAMGKSTKLLQFYLSQIFYHYNVYIIMIFFVFILKHHDTNVYKSFSFF